MTTSLVTLSNMSRSRNNNKQSLIHWLQGSFIIVPSMNFKAEEQIDQWIDGVLAGLYHLNIKIAESIHFTKSCIRAYVHYEGCELQIKCAVLENSNG